jgi:DUF971 family protein
MANPPTNIRALQEQGRLELHWDDGKVYRIPYKFVRGECPCASCIEEWTGRRLLDLNTVPDDIKPTQISFTGNYALKIVWSDGHSTGLYTWDHLAEICRRHGDA